MNVANVGDVEAVLCRHGEPLLLTKKFVTSADREECQRVAAADGIITEVSAGSPATIIKPPPHSKGIKRHRDPSVCLSQP